METCVDPLGREPSEGKLGDELGNMLWGIGSLRPEPVRGPIQSAKKRACRDCRFAGGQHALANTIRDQRTDASFVPIALGDDARHQVGRQRLELEVRGRPFYFVHQAEHVRDRQLAQPVGKRTRIAAGAGQVGEQSIERAVLAEKEQFVLAVKVVIEVARGEVGGDGNLAHPGRREAAPAEDLGGCFQDRHPARVGSAQARRTAVR